MHPILTYNSEVSFMDSYLPLHRANMRGKKNGNCVDLFSFIDKTPFEKVQLNFCKFLLGIKKSASNIAARAELGCLPIENFIVSQSLLYLARLHTENINPLLKEAFLLTKSLDCAGTYSWYTYIKNIHKDDNILKEIENCKTLKDLNSVKIHIKRSVEDKYKSLLENKIKSYDQSSKLFLYKNIKLNLEKEFYLKFHDFSIRKCFTKLRLSDHSLEIERGRYFKIPRENRLCRNCNVIESEEHFLIHCKLYINLRNKLVQDLNCKIEDITVSKLLNPSSIEHVKYIGSFLKQSLELRAKEA